MAKGNVAKEVVVEKIKEAFGADFLGVQDKKVYVRAKESGEYVQIAISMTCPKSPVDFGEISEEPAEARPVAEFKELSSDDKEKIRELKEKLGIS